MVATSLSSLWKKITRKKEFDGNVLDTQFNRCLSTMDLTFLGIGQMIGAGIFVLTGTIIRNKTGPAVFISFVFAGFTAFLNALCYAELSARYPKAGSAFTYTYVVAGELLGFLIGWSLILEYVLSVASVARGWSNTVDALAGHVISNGSMKYLRFPESEYFSKYPDFLATGIIFASFLLVISGPKMSKTFNMVVTIVNISLLCVMTIIMFIFANPSNFAEESKGGVFPYSFAGIIAGTGTCFYAYIGFDGLAVCTEEAKNPKRSMPVAMALSVGIVTLLFVSASVALPLFQPWYEISPKAAFSEAFASRGMIWAKYLVGIGSLFGMSASLFTSCYALPRMVYSVAEEGLLFQCFAYVFPSTKVPLWTILAFGPICGILALVIDVQALANFVSIGTLIAFTVVNINVLALRYRPTSVANSEDEPVTNTPVGSLIPRFNRIPVLNSLRPGIAVEISILIFMTFSILSEVMILRGTHYLKTWWMITLLCLFIIITLMSIFIIAIHEQDSSFDSYKLPAVPFIPCFCILLNESLIIKMKAIAWARYILWIIIGLIIYFAYGIRKSKLQEKEDEQKSLLNSTSDSKTPLDSGLPRNNARNRYVKME